MWRKRLVPLLIGSGVRPTPRLVALWLFLVGCPAAVMAQAVDKPDDPSAGPFVSHRAAEDSSLNLMLDYEALSETGDDYESPAPTGSFRAAQDVPPRVDWSRPVGRNWAVEPVLMQRRQAGQPIRPDDDEAASTVGVELRKRF